MNYQIRGNAELLSGVGVAIVGSRKASGYGIRVAERLGEMIVSGTDNRLHIVSGFADGIDKAAHTGALKGNGNTVCVMAADLQYTKVPSEMRNLMTAENTAFVSQFRGKRWSGRQAMQRNDTIRRHARCVIVVESGITKSGTFAMGNLCLENDTPLFVISPRDLEISGENGNAELINRGGMEIRFDTIRKFQSIPFEDPYTWGDWVKKGLV